MKKSKILLDYAVLLFTLCFTVLIFGPVEIFLSNREFFWFSLHDINMFAIPLLIVIWLFALFAIAVCNKFIPKVCQVAMAIIAGISLAGYIQGNYVMVDYGQMDGKTIQWENFKVQGIVSIALWVVIIAVCLILAWMKKDKFFDIAKWISGGISLIQIVTICVLMLSTHPFSTEKIYSATDKDEYTYSDENFVILLLDRFDSQAMIDILKEPDKDYNNMLDGFTFYSNTLGMYPCTDLAVGQILSGYQYKNEETYGKYVSKAYAESPLFNRLAENDWKLGIYTNLTLPHEISPDSALSKVTNWDNGGVGVSSHRNLAKYMYKFVGFRYLPQALKQTCWFYPDNMVSHIKTVKNDESKAYSWENINFYDQIPNIVHESSDSKTFKFIHIDGTHEPFTFNRYLVEQVEETSITEEGRGVMMIVQKYFEKLKELGIYDNSIIILMADHGHYDEAQAPLLMVKGKGEKHPLNIDDMALSYDDLQQIYSDLLDGKMGNELTVVPRIERTFYKYIYKINLKYESYARDITEYITTGEAHDAASFKETGVVYEGTDW